MLRLAVDLRPLLEPFESGVTQYTKALVREFLKRPEEVQLDLFYQARNRCERIHRLFPSVRHVPISNTRFHLRCLLGFPRLPLAYFKQRPDLIWLPDRRPFYRTEIPLVMTVHDKVPERFPRTLSVKSRLWHLIFPLNRLLALCGGVLVPTLTIRSQIRTKLPVEVTYEGVQLEPPETPEIAQALKKVPFFLSISPSDPRKRLDWFLAMADRFPKANFVVIGLKRGDARFARQKVKTRPNLHLLGEVTEAEKTWFLRHARALVAISMYEGFDLPVLEAVAAKCPVILSDIDVHHELYKDACFIRSKEDLEGVIYRALHSKIPVPHVRGEVVKDIAMHIAAMKPTNLSPDEVAAELIEKEKEIWREQLKNEGKPEQIWEKIMEGKEKKFREEFALLTQPFVKNPEKLVKDLLGSDTVVEFHRFEV